MATRRRVSTPNRASRWPHQASRRHGVASCAAASRPHDLLVMARSPHALPALTLTTQSSTRSIPTLAGLATLPASLGRAGERALWERGRSVAAATPQGSRHSSRVASGSRLLPRAVLGLRDAQVVVLARQQALRERAPRHHPQPQLAAAPAPRSRPRGRGLQRRRCKRLGRAAAGVRVGGGWEPSARPGSGSTDGRASMCEVRPLVQGDS